MGWVHRINQGNKEATCVPLEAKNSSGKNSKLFVELEEVQCPAGVTLEYREIKIHLSPEFNSCTLKRCLDVLRGSIC
jgi:hypothetical protein